MSRSFVTAVAWTVVTALTSVAPAAAGGNDVAAGRVPAWMKAAAEIEVPPTDADVVWVLDEFVVEPLPEGGVRERTRQVGRVMRGDGARTLGDWVETYALEDTVESLDVYTLDPEGRWRMAREDRKDIVDAPAFQAYPGYTAARQRVATSPALRIGSLAAFESVVVRDIDAGAARWLLGDPDAPTLRSRVELVVPDGWEADVVVERGDGLTVERSPGRIVVEGADLVRLPVEPLRPGAARILPSAWLRWNAPDGSRGFASWGDVATWFHRHSERVLDDAGEAARIATDLTPSSPAELLAAIGRAFDFVSRDVRYVAIQIGIGGFVPYSPAHVTRNRFGDCKDKTFLFRAILERWGLATYPVLVRTRYEGEWPEDVPSLAAFDHMIVAVALPDGVGTDLWPVVEVEGAGRLLLLDGTSREGDAWSLPDMDQGTRALLVRPDGGDRFDLPVAPPESARVRRVLSARVGVDGELVDADLEEVYSGGSATWKRASLAEASDDERRRDSASYVADRFPGARVAAHEIDGLADTGRTLAQRFRLEGGTVGKRVGSFLVLEPGRLAYDPLPGGLPEPPRRWDLVLREPREEVFEARIEVADGWRPETLPEPVSMTSDACEVDAAWSFEGGALVHRRIVRVHVNRVPVEDYAGFRDFVLAARGALAQAILLVRE